MGVRSLFIRLSGCNLKCPFCDTKYADLYVEVSNKEVVKLIERAYIRGVRNIIWTGGEPALQIDGIKDTIAMTEHLDGLTHAVETNGTIPFGTAIFDLVVVSPKDSVLKPDKLDELLTHWVNHWQNKPVVIKPVVSKTNIVWWMKWAAEHPKVKIYFMPMTPQDDRMIEEHNKLVKMIIQLMNQYKVNAAVSPRLHVLYRVR